ncbi:hypothetical protein Anapl_07477 [Anas platyrhynchos]|uniref:Uncharacterized protein n=1 Tax=Anas platyrhynchos TaxID=8839 RepID=R0LTB3_ANAPL|nr:hypothetical protein Anapl_07477 [Anas platyrhynchos]
MGAAPSSQPPSWPELPAALLEPPGADKNLGQLDKDKPSSSPATAVVASEGCAERGAWCHRGAAMKRSYTQQLASKKPLKIPAVVTPSFLPGPGNSSELLSVQFSVPAAARPPAQPHFHARRAPVPPGATAGVTSTSSEPRGLGGKHSPRKLLLASLKLLTGSMFPTIPYKIPQNGCAERVASLLRGW